MEGAKAPLPILMPGLRVAITAAANGIGRVMADSFRTAGGEVFICDADADALATSGHRGIRADAAEAGEMDGFVGSAIAALGGLDVLINNAGVAGPTAPIEEIEPEALDRVLRIDLAAMFHCARRAVPALKAAGGGCIINLSSAAGRFGFALRSPYAAAKWGVVGLTKTLAVELGPAGIPVNAILPGAVEGARIRAVLATKAAAAGVSIAEQTEKMLAASSLRCFVTQQDIANMALYLASPFGATISGQAIPVDADLQYLV